MDIPRSQNTIIRSVIHVNINIKKKKLTSQMEVTIWKGRREEWICHESIPPANCLKELKSIKYLWWLKRIIWRKMNCD